MKKKRAKPAMMFALSAVVFLCGGALVSSRIQANERLSSEVEALRAQLSREGDVKAELKEITLKVTESREKLNHLEAGVPQQAYMPTLMREIEALGSKNGIIVTGVRPMAAKFPSPPDSEGKPVQKAYVEQDVEVKGTGHYLKVLAFLNELENFPKIVAVSSVTLTPRAGTSTPEADPSLLEIAVEIRAFLFRDDKTASRGEIGGQGS